MKSMFLVLCLFAVAFCHEADEELNGGGVEGDMIFLGDFRSVVKGRRWPNNLLIYRFDSALVSSTRGRVQTAVQNLQNQLRGCVTFREYRSGDKAAVLIRNGGGCSASVGYYTGGGVMNLATACTVGNIMHEFLHNLGFFHEQSRNDRDGYVRINFENIVSGTEGNFRKWSSFDDLGVGYDYGSIMHYPNWAFSKNGRATIEALRPLNGKVMGQRQALSDSDLRKVRAAYRC